MTQLRWGAGPHTHTYILNSFTISNYPCCHMLYFRFWRVDKQGETKKCRIEWFISPTGDRFLWMGHVKDTSPPPLFICLRTQTGHCRDQRVETKRDGYPNVAFTWRTSFVSWFNSFSSLWMLSSPATDSRKIYAASTSIMAFFCCCLFGAFFFSFFLFLIVFASLNFESKPTGLFCCSYKSCYHLGVIPLNNHHATTGEVILKKVKPFWAIYSSKHSQHCVHKASRVLPPLITCNSPPPHYTS